MKKYSTLLCIPNILTLIFLSAVFSNISSIEMSGRSISKNILSTNTLKRYGQNIYQPLVGLGLITASGFIGHMAYFFCTCNKTLDSFDILIKEEKDDWINPKSVAYTMAGVSTVSSIASFIMGVKLIGKSLKRYYKIKPIKKVDYNNKNKRSIEES